MNKIWKFPLNYPANQVMGGRVLKISFQGGSLFAWIMVDGSSDQILEVLPTGQRFDPTGLEFIDTAVSDTLVWHVFRRMS